MRVAGSGSMRDVARCRRIAGAGRRQGPPRSTARRIRPSSTGCLPHSATRSSGAISFARSRSLKACGIPSSVDNPFDRDAGLNNERLHRSSRPSRSRVSDSFCFRRFVSSRKSAASLSKEGSSSPASAWRRISRCSASGFAGRLAASIWRSAQRPDCASVGFRPPSLHEGHC